MKTAPLSAFSKDWETWYSNQWHPCTIVEGPDLAGTSMQTSNAIKWEAHPSLIDYANKALEMDYFVSVKVEQDHIWCQDWNGQPVNPCNADGKQHHCAESQYTGLGPSHTANVIQAMNNIN